MCRVASLTLSDDIRSPAQARAWTERWLGSWEIDDEGITKLLVGELVTNAVKHTHTNSILTLAVAGGMIEVAVMDDDASSRPVIPAQRTVLPPTSPLVVPESGRGLRIVEALSDSWGVTPFGRGKQIWFRRPVAARWPYSNKCVCSTDGQTGHHLPSGHHALDIPGPWDTGPAATGAQ